MSGVAEQESTVELGVVAGYDGSEAARLAVNWAAEEASSRDLDLLVGYALPWPVAAPQVVPGALPNVGDSLLGEEMLRTQAEEILNDVADEIRRRWPGLGVRTRAESGRPADVLAWLGREADLLVVGASGRGALPRMVLGSTAAGLLHAAERPVVVVRPTQGEFTRPGRVVVGVDGTALSAPAIEFAYDFADRHGRELVAVHAWSQLPMDALEPVRAWDEDLYEVQRKAQRLLAECLAGQAEQHPGVVVRREISFRRAATALLHEAEHAALLVVGSHGRGALGSMLVGSVSHAMIYHAPCPVAVVRAEDD